MALQVSSLRREVSLLGTDLVSFSEGSVIGRKSLLQSIPPDLNTNSAQYRLAWDHGWLGNFSLETVSSCYVYMFVFSQNGPLWWSFWGLRRKREATENTTLSVENTQVVMSRSLGKCGGQRPFWWALWIGKELSQLVQLQCLVEVGLLRDKSGQSTEWIAASIWPYGRRENWLNCGLLL